MTQFQTTEYLKATIQSIVECNEVEFIDIGNNETLIQGTTSAIDKIVNVIGVIFGSHITSRDYDEETATDCLYVYYQGSNEEEFGIFLPEGCISDIARLLEGDYTDEEYSDCVTDLHWEYIGAAQ